MFSIGDVVVPGPRFPFDKDRFGLHRNSRGTIVGLSGERVTVEWNPGEANPQRGTYNGSDLMRG